MTTATAEAPAAGDVLARLLGRADLFDDPAAYEAGVHDTWAALTGVGPAPGGAPPPSEERDDAAGCAAGPGAA